MLLVRRRARHTAGRNRGSALLGVLVLGLVLSLMAGLGLHLVVSEIRLNRAFCDGVRAYYLAESGLVWGLSQVRRALDEGPIPPVWPQPPPNPFSHAYQEPHGFDTVIQTKGSQGGPGQAGATAEAVPGTGEAAGGRGGSAGWDGDQTGSPAAHGESTAGASQAGGATGQGAESGAARGQAGNAGASAGEAGATGAVGSGPGGGAREYEVTLKATGWYGEGRRAVRIMEARVTVTAKQDGKYHWDVEYWRQVAPEP